MRLEHRSSSFDRKHPDIFVKPGSDRMPADQGPTGVLDPTSMRPGGTVALWIGLSSGIGVDVGRTGGATVSSGAAAGGLDFTTARIVACA